MRILCDQKECPICRQDMPKASNLLFFFLTRVPDQQQFYVLFQVIHTQTRRKYEEVENEPFEIDKKYQICFENAYVKRAFKRLLQHRCPVCVVHKDDGGPPEEKIFVQFKQLDSHVRREHEMFYCDLCVEHLKVIISLMIYDGN